MSAYWDRAATLIEATAPSRSARDTLLAMVQMATALDNRRNPNDRCIAMPPMRFYVPNIRRTCRAEVYRGRRMTSAAGNVIREIIQTVRLSNIQATAAKLFNDMRVEPTVDQTPLRFW
jgi:hypothetical protein